MTSVLLFIADFTFGTKSPGWIKQDPAKGKQNKEINDGCNQNLSSWKQHGYWEWVQYLGPGPHHF